MRPSPSLASVLSGYVPTFVLRHCVENPSPITEPKTNCLTCAALFADISGFTALTEKLAQRGPVGAEELTSLLSGYFERIIEIVLMRGGDVVKLAGDGLVALWTTQSTGEALDALARRAAACGLAVQRRLHDYAAAEDVRLSLRIGIGAGEVMAMHVGGARERWELLFVGEPLLQMSQGNRLGRPGQVILSREAALLAGNACRGARLAGDYLDLEAVEGDAPAPASAPVAASSQLEEALWRYVPGAVRSRMRDGLGDWLSELRPVTVLFVNLPTIGTAGDARALAQAQAAMLAIQVAVYRYEGSINKISVDDKGVSLLAAMGLPPLAHENDAARGVLAAQAVRDGLAAVGLPCAIGVATGRAFCGTVGGQARREYTMIGDVVNLAARLMQAAGRFLNPDARPPDGSAPACDSGSQSASSGAANEGKDNAPALPDAASIICDSATRQAAVRLAFESVGPLTLKGKSQPVQAFRPLTRAALAGGGKKLVGREAESDVLSQSLRSLRGGESGLIIIEGEAGIGKSRLVEYLLDAARVEGVLSLCGAGDAIERTTPYHAWRSVFAQFFGVEGFSDPARARRRVFEQLGDDPEVVGVAPLLGAVLPLNWQDNEQTSPMTGEVRADNTNDLLLRLLGSAATRRPLLLVIDDGHWLDSASWALLPLAASRIRPMLLVVGTRPVQDPAPAEFGRLCEMNGVRRLRLEGLTPDGAGALIRQCLGVDAVAGEVVALIRQKAQGNPFFTEEFSYALRDAGIITTGGGVCRVAPDVKLKEVSFPDSVQGVITSRIDRLTPSEQLALKVASVIGRVFAFRVLQGIFPREARETLLASAVDVLAKLDLTPRETHEPDAAYIFKHVITQEVAYNLMLFSQRRDLHRAAAEWHERTHGGDLTPYYALLAHHWGRAGDALKTLQYLERAGNQALAQGVYQESVEFFTEAIRLSESKDFESAAASPAELQRRRAYCERRLGDAFMALGRLELSRQHTERSLQLLRRPIIKSRRLVLVKLVAELASQAWRRAGIQGTESPASAQEREDLMETSRAYERIGQLAYYDCDLLTATYAAVRALNLAEKGGAAAETARAAIEVCVGCSLVGLQRLGSFYDGIAQRSAPRNDPYTRAWVLELSGLFNWTNGDWSQGRVELDAATNLASRIGDWRRWAESTTETCGLLLQDAQFARVAELCEPIIAQARGRGHHQAQAWGLCNGATALLHLGRVDEAAEMLESAYTLVGERLGKAEAIHAMGALAAVRWRVGRHEAALAVAAEALELIRRSRPTANYVFEGYSGAAETFLLALERYPDAGGAGHEDLLRSAADACAALRTFARFFPFSRARVWRWCGLFHWIRGRRFRAARSWRKSAYWASRFDMQHELAMTMYEKARHLPPGDLNRRALLADAAAVFRRLGAAHYERLVEAEEAPAGAAQN